MDEARRNATTGTAAALLESMRAVQKALMQTPRLPSSQLAARIQEWQELVMELASEQAQGAELATLYETIRVLSSSLDLTQTLSLVMDSLIRLTGAERSCLMLLDDRGSLEIKAARHFNHKSIAASDLALSHTVVRNAVNEGEPVLTTNAQLDPRFSARESVVGYQLRSIACIPLHVREERVIGAIYLDNRLRAGVFSESDLPMLTAFARQAAVAIENARLYEEVRRRSEELAATVVRLQEMDRLKSEFIQNVSHELRTPLSVIYGYTTLLDEGEFGELQSEQRESMATIRQHIQTLRDVVEDITLILAAETRPPELELVRLDELVRAAIEDSKTRTRQAGLTMRTEMAPDVPPVRGSAAHLRRVLDSLLSNAVKFTPEGGTIVVRLRREDDQVILQVIDTGIGIPRDHQERIFDRFYQVDGSSRRRYGGMGLGLALVKEVIEAHGGTVAVESQVDKGSTFTVTLPIPRE